MCQAGSPEDIPPIIATPHHYLINIYRNQLYFVAVVTTEGICSLMYLHVKHVMVKHLRFKYYIFMVHYSE